MLGKERVSCSMQTKRLKARSRHVRTGCITCKNRRVKCPEEKPLCSRCLKGGFICKGYAVPKPWLFESRLATTDTSGSSSASTANSPTGHTIPSSSSTDHGWLPTRSSSPVLLHGNSDPFNTLAIPISPAENFYLRHYVTQLLPQMFTIPERKWFSAMYSDYWSICMRSLEDHTAAYSLLARIAAIFIVETAPASQAPAAMLRYYQLRAQATLRKKLLDLNSAREPKEEEILPVMWASHNLGYADLVLKDKNATYHLRAMTALFSRCFRLTDILSGKGVALFPIHIEIQRACTSLTRPWFSMERIFPSIQQIDRTRKWRVPEETWSTHVHPDVQDVTTRRMILMKREGQYVHRDLDGHCFAIQDIQDVSFMVMYRNLWFQGQMLNIILDTIEESKTVILESLQGQRIVAKALIATATLHWGRFASQFPVNGKLLFDDAPATIPLLQTLLQQIHQSSGFPGDIAAHKSYACARFWALFVGAQAEQNRQEILKLAPLCGDWFLVNFESQAQSMGILSWRDAVHIFEQFLYNDMLEPHISKWWPASSRQRIEEV